MQSANFKIVLDDDHKAKVEELRSKVKNYATESAFLRDLYLARFLVTKDWDVDRAAQMFVGSMEWRQSTHPEAIHENFPKAEIFNHLNSVYWPGRIVGNTKDGWPVYVESVGKLDTEGIMNKVDEAARIEYGIWKLEDNEVKRKVLEESNGNSETAGMTVVLDLTGVGWGHFSALSLSFFKEASNLSKRNYPETLRRLYIVNTPALFTMMWKIITPMLDKSTLKKTQILGSDYLDVLTQEIDIDVIPSNLGGNAPAISGGGPYYNPGEEQVKSVGDPWEVATVPRSGVHEKEVVITERGSIIFWEFSTEDHDVGFGVFYKRAGEDERIEDLPVKRYDSNLEVIRDLLVANKPGTYILHWDNTFSWTKRKFLEYRYNVLAPSLLSSS